MGDGNIKFGAVSSGSWTPYVHYFEPQKFSFDNEGCIIYGAQEDIDSYVDYQIQSGIIPQSTVDLFTKMGFMDSASLDSKPHFHSSMLFLFRQTGNGFNGNALQDPLIAGQKFGIIPWTSLPFDQNTTQADCLAPNPQNLLDIGQQFLLAVGGKGWLKYHWVNEGGPTDTLAMDIARQQSPLIIAVLAESPGWNQYEPPIVQGTPCHGVLNYDKNSIGELILDHYAPFEKVLQNGYPINYVIQAVIQISPPPPAPVPPSPTFPANPTPTQTAQWLVWLQKLWTWMTIIE
jgi:hypothetical protein